MAPALLRVGKPLFRQRKNGAQRNEEAGGRVASARKALRQMSSNWRSAGRWGKGLPGKGCLTRQMHGHQ
ncbi:hypothetical protein [Pontibacter diazotrophicus]|uniref:hypothetical protein n=1 Tax=Pontibacter diazotrophicus TaxID=1400979 RepID=UPI0011C0549D|nr:hypothetical protein [Pontibacter diazotrophicus]